MKKWDKKEWCNMLCNILYNMLCKNVYSEIAVGWACSHRDEVYIRPTNTNNMLFLCVCGVHNISTRLYNKYSFNSSNQEIIVYCKEISIQLGQYKSCIFGYYKCGVINTYIMYHALLKFIIGWPTHVRNSSRITKSDITEYFAWRYSEI